MPILGGIGKALRDNFGMAQATTAQKPNWKNGFQVDGSDYSVAELNAALGGGSVSGLVTGIAAGATQTQGGATALTGTYNNVTTVTTAGDGVKLPAAVAGLRVVVRNSDATDSMKVYPNTSDTIAGGSANVAVDQAAGTEVTYTAVDATDWKVSTAVNLAGAETIAGVKTFSAIPVLPATGITVGSTTFTETQLGALDPTLGAETASHAVTLDSNKLYAGGRLTHKVYSIAAASSALSATSATAFSNGTAAVPTGLVAGDEIHFAAVVEVDTVDGVDSLQITATYAGATILDTTAIAAAVDTDKIVIHGTISTRTVHASTGTAYAEIVLGGEIGATALDGAVQVSTLSSLNNAGATNLIILGAFGGAGNTASLQKFTVWVN